MRSLLIPSVIPMIASFAEATHTQKFAIIRISTEAIYPVTKNVRAPCVSRSKGVFQQTKLFTI